jgi:hypothetical protein
MQEEQPLGQYNEQLVLLLPAGLVCPNGQAMHKEP